MKPAAPLSRILLLAAASLLSGQACSQAPIEPTTAPVSPAVEPAAPGAAMVQTPVADDGYRLGTGDKVRVIVYGEEDLSGEFQVDSTGTVRLPLLGQVQARDKTVRDFEHDVAADFVTAGYLKNPQISVEVLAYRPFYIIGEVNKPGEYPYHNGMNVLNAVAVAGGYTYRSNKSKVYIRPSGKTDEVERPANGDTQIGPGDIVRIPERFF